MKDTIIVILRYLGLLLVLAVLTGYLSVKERLPALVPEAVADQMKQITLNLISGLTGKKETVRTGKLKPLKPGTVQQARGSGSQARQIPAVPVIRTESQNFFYAAADWLVLGARLRMAQSMNRSDAKKLSETILNYRGLMSALSESEPFVFFLMNPGREDKRFELKSYLEKFLKDNDDALGFEVRGADGVRLMASAKAVLAVPSVPMRGDFGVVSFRAGSKDCVAFARTIQANDRELGQLTMVYDSSILGALAAPESFDSAVLVIAADGRAIYARASDAPRLKPLIAAFSAPSRPRSADVAGMSYRAVYAESPDGLTVVTAYRPVSAWQMTVNILILALAAGLAVFLVWVVAYLYRNVWLKSRRERVRKEEIITGTISEMVKTLKSTAELTARMAEGTREDIGLLERTIDKFQSSEPRSAETPGGEEGGDGWEVAGK